MEKAMAEGCATVPVKRAATILGVNQKGVYSAIQRGEIRAIKIGGRIVIPMSAINEMLSGSAA